MKKLTLVMMAFALVLGLSQCKKPNVPDYSGTVGKRVKQNVTLSASRGDNGNSKVSYDGEELVTGLGWVMKFKWDNGDQIIAYDSEGCCGTLTLRPGTEGSAVGIFDGELEVLEGSNVKFYYFGENVTSNGGNTYSVDFNTQNGQNTDEIIGKLVLFGTSGYQSTGIYSATMGIPFSVVKLQFDKFGTDNDVLVRNIASTGFSIDNKGALTFNEAASMNFKTPGQATDFYAVFMPKEATTYKFSNTEGYAETEEPWTLNGNTFYTKNGSSTGEAVLIEGRTPAAAPTVTTVEGCTEFVYSCGGTVTLEAAQNVEFGVVYSEIKTEPVIDDKDYCTTVKCGTESLKAGDTPFAVDLKEFESGHTYYVRAYAIGETGVVVYPTDASGIKTTVGGNAEVLPVPTTWTVDGTNPHPFTVALGVTVKFSRGNLQWSAEGTHNVAIGEPKSGTWKFAENQIEIIGTTQGTEETSVTRDLFGWGTSGYHQIADDYNKYYMPYSITLEEPVQIAQNYYGYGPSTNVVPGGPSGQTQTVGDISGSYYDWGVYNDISNDGALGVGAWRTMTYDEWNYLLNTRPDASDKWGFCLVGCKRGMIILPDDYVAPEGVEFVGSVKDWTTNKYTFSEFSEMEKAGAIFLPSAGCREVVTVNNAGRYGHYWASSYKSSSHSYGLWFHTDEIGLDVEKNYRYFGKSVRLVRNAE